MALFLLNSAQLTRKQFGALGIVYLKSNSYSTEAPRSLKTTNLASLKRGTGGRSSFNGMIVTVFGCSGFVGRYVANKFGKIGSQCIFPYRGDHSDLLRLKLAGDLGQVLFQFYHLEDMDSIKKAIAYSNVVVNLVGREWETKCFKFNDVHVDGARRIARACREVGVERLIHVSAMNVTPKAEPKVLKRGSNFLPSKYYGEIAVREEFPDATIIRPADIYGSEDRFLRYYAHILRHQIHFMPLWYKGERTYKQPVFVSDIAQAIVNAAKDPDSAGKTYQGVGPRRYQLAELVDWFHREMRKTYDLWGYWRYDLRYDPTFMMKVKFVEAITPSWPIGNIHSERVEQEYVTDNVIEGMPTLEDLGVNLTYMEDQVPWELRPYRAMQYYDADLNEFGIPELPKYVETRGAL